ncbi:MAG: ABC transporter ATP-binding protein [Bacilli bacterium]|nr:ABC transporter ATP-binding protein [Bacilli bacterium]
MKDLKAIVASIKYVYNEAKNYSKSYIGKVVVYCILSIVAPLLLLLLPTICVYYISTQGDFITFVLVLNGVFAGYITCLSISTYLEQMITWDNTFVRLKRFFRKIYEKCVECDYKFYEASNAKEERLKAEEALYSNWRGVELIMKTTPKFFIDGISLLIFVASSTVVSYQVLLILLGMIIVFLIIEKYAVPAFIKAKANLTTHYNKERYIYKSSKNELKGKDIRNYRLANLLDTAMNKQFTLYAKYARIQSVVLVLPNLSNTIFGFFRDLVAYTLLTTAVINGSISVTEYTLMIGIINSISASLVKIGKDITDLHSASLETRDYIGFMNEQSEFNHGEGLDIKTLTRPLSIEFRNVVYQYKDLDKPTINGLSFKINPGEKIALVGENGAGKTTIIKLLSGFYKPTSGEILINGHKIDEFNILDYYSMLSVINQDVEILGVSIKNTVAVTDLAVDEVRLNQAIKDAGLEAKVASLKKGTDTYLTKNLDEEGVLLSGGETQKLMLARALYKDGDILMLDEPTSALDPIAEGEIYQKYNDLTKGKTSIFISHRLSSTRFCDRIFYLRDGHIVEEGNHEELMAKHGEYYEVFTIQAHYYQNNGGNGYESVF